MAAPKTSDELRQDPLVQSLLADFDRQRTQREAQSIEDMKRLGVLRGGDMLGANQRMIEDRTRGELDILSDAAMRKLQERQGSEGRALDLAGLLSGRDLALSELTGWVGGKTGPEGTPTLGGMESELNLIAAMLATLDPQFVGKYDPLADQIAGMIGRFTGEGTGSALQKALYEIIHAPPEGYDDWADYYRRNQDIDPRDIRSRGIGRRRR